MQFANNPFSAIPPVVKNLLIINVIFFLVMISGIGNFAGKSMTDWFGLHFLASPLFKPWQLVTHMFMHGGIWHIAFNMFGLYMFGPPLEYRWGAKKFLTFYMIAGVGAALFYMAPQWLEYSQLMHTLSPDVIEKAKEGLAYQPVTNDVRSLLGLYFTPMVGASGALYGILLAFGLTFPEVELMMFPLPIPIKAKYFIWIFAGMSVFFAMRDNPGDNVAHLAHLGGMVVGFITLKVWGEVPKRGY